MTSCRVRVRSHAARPCFLTRREQGPLTLRHLLDARGDGRCSECPRRTHRRVALRLIGAVGWLHPHRHSDASRPARPTQATALGRAVGAASPRHLPCVARAVSAEARLASRGVTHRAAKGCARHEGAPPPRWSRFERHREPEWEDNPGSEHRRRRWSSGAVCCARSVRCVYCFEPVQLDRNAGDRSDAGRRAPTCLGDTDLGAEPAEALRSGAGRHRHDGEAVAVGLERDLECHRRAGRTG